VVPSCVIEIRQYVDRRGRNSFVRWLDSLSDPAQASVSMALLRLESGNTSSAKSVGAGVYELRIHFGPGFRVYFGWDGQELVILLAGGSKKRQRTDIERAKELWQELKERKREGTWR
jgi:putative addiction module killer protein